MSRTITLPDLDDATILSSEYSAVLSAEYENLQQARDQLEQRMREIKHFLKNFGPKEAPSETMGEAPEWHCRRCGHDWKGRVLPRPPRVCPRCGSVGWQEDPSRAGSRRPTDPPSPRWGTKLRNPAGPAPLAQPEKESTGPETVVSSNGEKTVVTVPPREPVPVEPVPAPASAPASPFRLSPPPRFIPPTPATPVLVPSQDVRFGEGGAPLPDRKIPPFELESGDHRADDDSTSDNPTTKEEEPPDGNNGK